MAGEETGDESRLVAEPGVDGEWGEGSVGGRRWNKSQLRDSSLD